LTPFSSDQDGQRLFRGPGYTLKLGEIEVSSILPMTHIQL